MAKITVMNTDITVINYSDHDYISLTDMASAKEGDSRAADIIKNWMRNRYTIEFLGTWEEFDHFRMQAGLPSFVLSASEHAGTSLTHLCQRSRCAKYGFIWDDRLRMA